MRGPTLRIVCVNDVYGLDNLPHLRSLVRHHATHAPADLLLVTLAGDFVAPSLLSSLDRGAAMVDCLNEVPVTHVIFGNHEDDVPYDALQARAREFRGVWLNGNLLGFEPALPTHQVLDLGGEGVRPVRVGLVGVLSEDPALYRPGAFGGHVIAPANATAVEEARTLLASAGCGCVLALTHQSIDRDRALARQRDVPLPLVIGGHEHEPHLENVDGCWVVKAGSEASHAVIVDLAWPDAAPAPGTPDLPAARVRLEDVRAHPAEPHLAARVARHHEPLRALKDTTLLALAPGEALSSVGTRARQTSLGAMLCARVRDALGADACVINGGGIRASREYRGAFTYGDLESELPFSNEVVMVRLPGSVLRATIAASRARAPTPWAGFLQVDDGVAVGDDNVPVTVRGAPLDDAREYCVATVRLLLQGLDGIEPLLAFVRAHPERVPPRDAGSELKVILVETFALDLWHALGPFEVIDADRDELVSPDDLRAAIAAHTREAPSALLIAAMLRALDTSGDAKISRAEAEAAARRAR